MPSRSATTITAARLREGDWLSVLTVQSYFGSWNAAIIDAQ